MLSSYSCHTQVRLPSDCQRTKLIGHVWTMDSEANEFPLSGRELSKEKEHFFLQIDESNRITLKLKTTSPTNMVQNVHVFFLPLYMYFIDQDLTICHVSTDLPLIDLWGSAKHASLCRLFFLIFRIALML